LTGASYQTQGRLPEAARAYAQALEAEPTHFWARYFQGICYLQLLQASAARDSFTTCLGTKGDYPWLYLLRGLAHGQLNDFAAAEQDYDRAQALLAKQPNPQARYGILVNRAALRVRQAQPVAGVFSLAWLRRAEN